MKEGSSQPPITIKIRAAEQQRDLIEQAAEHLGRSPERFVLDAACREAEDVLLDRVYFILNEQDFAQFKAMVDNPPPPTDRLRHLLATKTPWE